MPCCEQGAMLLSVSDDVSSVCVWLGSLYKQSVCACLELDSVCTSGGVCR